jgi:hypothetical protein
MKKEEIEGDIWELAQALMKVLNQNPNDDWDATVDINALAYVVAMACYQLTNPLEAAEKFGEGVVRLVKLQMERR